METKLLKQIKLLKIYIAVLTAVIIVLIFFKIMERDGTAHFKEITAERINIIEGNGKLKMVISNAEKQHPGIIDGKVVPPRAKPAGIIFFNDDGDECGGLIFDGNKNAAGMVYSVDQYKNDQIMQLQYGQADQPKLNRSYGLKLWDRDDDFTSGDILKEIDSLKKINDTAVYNSAIAQMRSDGKLGIERLFVGKTKNKNVGIFINDKKGHPRIKLFVDDNNKAVIQVLDSLGRPVTSY